MEPAAMESAPLPPPASKQPLPLEEKPAPAFDPAAAWKGMLDSMKKNQPSIYSMISAGRYGGFADDCFRLNFPPEQAFFSGFLMEDERRKLIEASLSKQAGRPVRLEAGSEKNEAQEKDARQAAQADVKALSDMFGRQNLIVTGAEGLGPL